MQVCIILLHLTVFKYSSKPKTNKMNKRITQLALIACLSLLIACGGKKQTQEDNPSSETTTTEAPQESSKAEDYISVPGPIEFDGVTYNLAWSKPSQNGYYIQEYLPEGQNIDQYTDLLILDYDTDTSETMEQAVKRKIKWVEDRKRTDLAANYKVIKNEEKNEYLVDLIITEGQIVEWDAIRYVEYRENGKYIGMSTFTLSKRAYGDNMLPFMEGFRPERKRLISEFISIPIPKVTIKK